MDNNARIMKELKELQEAARNVCALNSKLLYPFCLLYLNRLSLAHFKSITTTKD